MRQQLTVERIKSSDAAIIIIREHYLHRKPSISDAFCLRDSWWGEPQGIITLGVPASHHLRVSVAPRSPDVVFELNRLWVSDRLPRNTETWFLSRALRAFRPAIVVSYADTTQGHLGYVYRAANWRYAGWTDMERRLPRLDYIPISGKHTRDASRSGIVGTLRRKPKVREL